MPHSRYNFCGNAYYCITYSCIATSAVQGVAFLVALTYAPASHMLLQGFKYVTVQGILSKCTIWPVMMEESAFQQYVDYCHQEYDDEYCLMVIS